MLQFSLIEQGSCRIPKVGNIVIWKMPVKKQTFCGGRGGGGGGGGEVDIFSHTFAAFIEICLHIFVQ